MSKEPYTENDSYARWMLLLMATILGSFLIGVSVGISLRIFL